MRDHAQIKDAHRDARGARGIRMVDDLNRDVRYAVRQFRRAPGFAVAAILCLALGIGATTAIYSVVNTVLLQPLPFRDSDRLVRVIEHVPSPAAGRPAVQRDIPYQDFLDWRAHARTLSDSIAVAGMGQRLVRTSQGAAGLWGAETSPNAFAVLGVRAMLGRALDAGDAANRDVAVLTFDTWQRHFNADPKVVGTMLELRAGALQDAAPPRLLTIVGVLPSDFTLPTGPADFYTPLRPPTASGPSPRVTLIARLAPGVSLRTAMDELSAMGGASRPPWPTSAPPLTGPRFEAQRLKDLAVSDLKPALGLFLAAVVVVLLIVCANVANLLVARGTARQREMALRLAIGASRARIVRQIMTECLVLAIAGGALGALVGAAGVAMVKRLATVDAPGIFGLMFGSTILPRAHEVHFDVTVLGIAFGIAAITSVVFGLLPALHLSRTRQLTTIGEAITIGAFVPPGRTLEEVRRSPTKPRLRSVSDGFLTAMGVPVLDGREFAAGDVAGAAPVLVINRSAAQLLFGSARAVGQPVNWYVVGGDTPAQMSVIGVVEDVRQESLAQERFPEVYVDYRQFLSLLERWPPYARRQNEWAIGFLSFAIRTGDSPESVMPAIRRLVSVVDPNVGIDALVPMTRLVADSVARQRFSAVVLGAFAAVAGILAAIGIYGVLAYLVVQRTLEIGIRMALGAQRAEVLALVLRKGLLLTAIGIAVGLIGATALTRVLQRMLFGITPLDPMTFVAVAATFGLLTTFASYIPARRATKVDPIVALRSE